MEFKHTSLSIQPSGVKKRGVMQTKKKWQKCAKSFSLFHSCSRSSTACQLLCSWKLFATCKWCQQSTANGDNTKSCHDIVKSPTIIVWFACECCNLQANLTLMSIFCVLVIARPLFVTDVLKLAAGHLSVPGWHARKLAFHMTMPLLF